jgi:hypothetical protein
LNTESIMGTSKKNHREARRRAAKRRRLAQQKQDSAAPEQLQQQPASVEASALTGRWPMDRSERRRVVAGLTAMATESADPDVKIRASRTLVQADALNVRDEQLNVPQQIDVNHRHSGAIGIVALRQELIHDPEYLDFLRARAMEEDAQGGNPASVLDVSAADGETNGHSLNGD